MLKVYIKKSTKSEKKYMVTIVNGKTKTVHFGANGYSDYTIHKDYTRMQRYENRHKSRENWTKTGIYSPGFWSKWILWSKPSLSQAIAYTSKKFNINIIKGSPPPNSSKTSPKRYKSPKTSTKQKR
tara:strand:+ start:100 stop:477 length:378 start_codon:yes stop_codon:yes gene_type:complete